MKLGNEFFFRESACRKEFVVLFSKVFEIRMILFVNFGFGGLEIWSGSTVELNSHVARSKSKGPKYEFR